MKIAALTPMTSAYVEARYTHFTRQFPHDSLFLIELGRTSSTYPWQPSHATVPYERVVVSEQPSETQPLWQLGIAIFKALNQIQPDVVVICGYGVRGMLFALLWSRLYRKPAVLLSDTKADDAMRDRWRESIKRYIIKHYQAALVAGAIHRQYLIQVGMPAEAISLGYDVVGNDRFHPQTIRQLPRPCNAPYFLATSRFIPKKNLLFLISAYAAYRQTVGDDAWDLVVCGDGPLRPQLEHSIQALGLTAVVHLPGFLQPAELLPYYAHAQCLIHASLQEQWGLVVNEAMAAGLPVLVSRRCGCFAELVVDGVNGYGFDPQHPAELTELMLKLSSGYVDLAAMGQASLQQIQTFSPDTFAQGLRQAIEYAIAHVNDSGVQVR